MLPKQKNNGEVVEISCRSKKMMMSDYEIQRSYCEARNPGKQIQILSELNLCDVKVIKGILKGSNVKLMKKVNYIEFERLYLQGKSDFEAAKRLKCSPLSVRKWRQMKGLPSNTGKKPSKLGNMGKS